MKKPFGNQISNPIPLDEIYGDTKSIKTMFHWFVVLIVIGLIVGAIITFTVGNFISMQFIFISIFLVLTSLFLIHQEKFESAMFFLAIILTSLLTVVASRGLGIHQTSNLAYPIILIIASLIVKKRALIFLTLYIILCIAWLVFGDVYNIYVPKQFTGSAPRDFYFYATILLITAAIVRLMSEAVFKGNFQLQNELKERKTVEQKYRNVFENSIDGIFQSTPEGRLISVNSAMAHMYGYDSPEDMVNHVTDIASQVYIDPKMRDKMRQRLEETDQIRGYEALEYRKDGSTLWTAMNGQVIRDDKGQVLYYEGTVENITARKEMDIKRKEAETLYRTLVEQTSIVVYRDIPDEQGTPIYISPQIEKLLGYTPEEWLKEPNYWQTLVHPEDLPHVLIAIENYLQKHHNNSSMEYRLKHKDGTWRWIRDETVLIKDETGKTQFVQGVFLDINERKQAENSLIQFRQLIDESNDAIFIIDPETSRYLDFNRTACELFGYTREELSQLGVINLAEHITNMDIWHERVNLVRKDGGILFEGIYRRKNGTTFPVEVSASLLNYGNDSAIVAILRDTTQRKQAERNLQENENRLQAFFNQSLDGFFFSMFERPIQWHDSEDKDKILLDVFYNQKFTDVNQAMLDQYGITREKFLSLTSNDIFLHDPDQGLQIRRQLFDNGHLHLETFERKENGTPVWFEGEYACLYDEQHRITGFFGIQRDITSRKHEELERAKLINELAYKNEESTTLKESLASIIDTLDFTEIIQRILDQIKRVIPYDSASVWTVEDGYQKFIAGRDLPQGTKQTYPIDSTNSATPLIQGDVAYVLSNNVQDELQDFQEYPDTLVNSWLAIPLKTRGKVIGFIALDGHQQEQFNERHIKLAIDFANQVAIALENSRLFSDLETELALRKNLISELEAKNSELERFTYTVSHDLKSPLVTINGFLGYLEADILAGDAQRVQRDRERIQGAVNKMYLLLNDLLELSRIGRLMNKPEMIQFEDLANDAIQIVHGRLEANHVTVHTQPNLPAIYGDRQRLTEVLQNLLDNAAKFTSNQTDPQIEIGHLGEENGKPIFYVKDNGIGIAPQYHEQIFGLFNKLDTQGEGTGIGLALVKRIIEIHNGRIWVESEAGQGTTFFFTLQASTET